MPEDTDPEPTGADPDGMVDVAHPEAERVPDTSEGACIDEDE